MAVVERATGGDQGRVLMSIGVRVSIEVEILAGVGVSEMTTKVEEPVGMLMTETTRGVRLLDHYAAAENFLHSPLALRKMHKLTDKQFTWVSLRARARMEAWGDCEKLVVGKGWLGGKKAIGSVSPGEVVTVLSTAGAPGDTLSVILGLVDNMEEKLMLAKKVGVASVVVDVLVTQKDRLAIISYQATLPANSRDWFYADNALRNSVKWKN